VCSFVCCVSFDRGVILCDVCYLSVVSYCKPLPPGKNPFTVYKYYITLHILKQSCKAVAIKHLLVLNLLDRKFIRKFFTLLCFI
jgi:hypothetical protein